MTSAAAAVLESWRFAPGFALLLAATAVLYLRGWAKLRAQMPAQFPPWRLAAFLGGLAVLYVAAASPLDTFAGLLLQVHMVQHLLLMIVAPALLLLGSPVLPLLRGLPAPVAKTGLGPFLAAPEVRRLGEALSHPLFCWLAISLATWFWHTPGPYQLALRSPFWHEVEHACFLTAGLLFWWPVVQPWPSRPHWPEWTVPVYLLLADVQNTALAALLVFSERLLYPIYGEVPRLAGISAQDDQVAAGLLMWVPMSMAYLVPAVVITVRLLSPAREARLGSMRPSRAGLVLGGSWSPGPTPSRSSAASPLPPAAAPMAYDLLRLPILGAVLRSAATRRLLQSILFLLAAAVVADGFLGPQMSPMNLAGVLPWTYWRAFTAVALLAAGNFFCMACPFTLPRDLARRLGLGRLNWPRALRSKWIAVGLLVAFFWANETFGLWNDPRATALLILAYFGTAFAVDATFRGASFCKYVCPIGQFNFIQSLLSPLEVKVRQPTACATCTTHDCLRGNERSRGCETDLFLPRKAGSLDCTFCLDCVRACPHDNIGLVAVLPGRTLWSDPERASIGRFSRRLDIAALALVLTFASLVSAAAMVGPVLRWQSEMASTLGLGTATDLTSAVLLLGIAVAPVVLLTLGGAIGRRLSGVHASGREIFCRLALALVPLGAAMWTAHFLFHLSSGWGSAGPVLQRAAASAGFGVFGEPNWSGAVPRLGAEALLHLEVLLLDAGVLLALYSGWRVAVSYTPSGRAALALLLPWSLIALALWASGVWVFLQPMQMRGMMSH